MPDLVVIPTWNEREAIGSLLPAVRRLAPEVGVLVVDDGSPDGTQEVVTDLARRLGGIELLAGQGRAGLAAAYTRGFRAALEQGATRVAQMDADGSHHPADLPRLLAVEADLVLGSRYVPGGGTRRWAWHRRLLSRFGSAYARAFTGVRVSDLTGGFKVWRADLLREVLGTPLSGQGYVFQVETTRRAWRRGARIVEVPIVFSERVLGVSKMSPAIAWEAAWRVPLLRG